MKFSEKRRTEQTERICPNNIKNNESGKLEIVSSKDLSKYSTDKVLVCENLKTKPLSEFKTCNFDSTMPGAVSVQWEFARLELIPNRFVCSLIFQVYINKSLSAHRVDGIKHTFTALSEKFGHKKPLEDVFELFGEFEAGSHDVLFDVSRSLEFLIEKFETFFVISRMMQLVSLQSSKESMRRLIRSCAAWLEQGAEVLRINKT